MTIYSLLKTLLKEKNMTQVKLSEIIDSNPQRLKGILMVGNPSASNMIKILNALDCDLVFQPKTAGTRKAGVYPLEGGYKE